MSAKAAAPAASMPGGMLQYYQSCGALGGAVQNYQPTITFGPLEGEEGSAGGDSDTEKDTVAKAKSAPLGKNSYATQTVSMAIRGPRNDKRVLVSARGADGRRLAAGHAAGGPFDNFSRSAPPGLFAGRTEGATWTPAGAMDASDGGGSGDDEAAYANPGSFAHKKRVRFIGTALFAAIGLATLACLACSTYLGAALPSFALYRPAGRRPAAAGPASSGGARAAGRSALDDREGHLESSRFPGGIPYEQRHQVAAHHRRGRRQQLPRRNARATGDSTSCAAASDCGCLPSDYCSESCCEWTCVTSACGAVGSVMWVVFWAGCCPEQQCCCLGDASECTRSACGGGRGARRRGARREPRGGLQAQA